MIERSSRREVGDSLEELKLIKSGVSVPRKSGAIYNISRYNL